MGGESGPHCLQLPLPPLLPHLQLHMITTTLYFPIPAFSLLPNYLKTCMGYKGGGEGGEEEGGREKEAGRGRKEAVGKFTEACLSKTRQKKTSYLSL